MDSNLTIGGDHLETAISAFQAAAVAYPYRSTRDLVGQEEPAAKCTATDCPQRRPGCDDDAGCPCSFQDFDRLFEQLMKPAIMELARPLPIPRRVTKRRVGSNPAAHNRALLGEPRERDDGTRAAG